MGGAAARGMVGGAAAWELVGGAAARLVGVAAVRACESWQEEGLQPLQSRIQRPKPRCEALDGNSCISDKPKGLGGSFVDINPALCTGLFWVTLFFANLSHYKCACSLVLSPPLPLSLNAHGTFWVSANAHPTFQPCHPEKGCFQNYCMLIIYS